MANDPLKLPHGDQISADTPAAAMARIQEGLRAIHPHAAFIITAHAALELEVSQILKRSFARPEKLPRLSMKHRLEILRSLFNDGWFDDVLDAISAYGAVRNAIAHGDSPETVAKAINKLAQKASKIGTTVTPDTHLGTVGMNLAGALHVGVESAPPLGSLNSD